jgi:hypothetical protein
MLVSTTVLLTILSSVTIGVLSGYIAVCGILRLLARREGHRADPQATQVIATAAHASGD